MMKKFAHWDAELEAGAMDAAQWPRLNWTTKCVNGIAAAIPGDPHHTFRCKNVSFPNIKFFRREPNSSCRLISTTSSTMQLLAPQ
jgi:hypothetical protein